MFGLKLENHYARLPGEFYTLMPAEKVGVQPRLLHANPKAASLIGLDADAFSDPAFTQVFSGHAQLGDFTPLAMVYSGHQFGVWAGQLGDGRALLIGQARNAQGELWDIQLKGAGQTPYSRFADGRAVMLEGIRLPPEQALQDRALTALRAMALPGSVSFTAWLPQIDRYGRLRVQGFGALWLQAALLEQGLARVAIAPDRTECFPDLYEAEARARARHAGLWALVAYRVRAPSELKDAVGSFQLVEGKVSNIGRADGRIFIDFGGRQTVSAVIAADDHRAFRDFDLDGLPGHRIRIRGIVQDYRGRPEILLSSPAQIEVLD